MTDEPHRTAPGCLFSVVTRTMGNRVFLERVLASLGRAALANTQWVLVDDAGDSDAALTQVLSAARDYPGLRPVRVRSGARHRAKALNAGLAVVGGRFVHVLDDDDTVDADFYAAVAEEFERAPGTAAVAVRATMVEETIDAGGTIREIRRTPHFPEIQAIPISTMLNQQVVPLCSVVFRAEAMRDVGPFAPDLPVCEDHEFLLRFLLRYDIALLDRLLMAFHVRPEGGDPRFANSDSSRRHAAVDAAFRNALLRRSLADPSDPLGMLLLWGDLTRGAAKFDRATRLLGKNRIWSAFYRLVRRG